MSLCGNNNPCPDLITGQKCGITYTGARYVPLFSDPAEWSSANAYEPLTIVIHEGNSYTSKTFVPVGVDISNEKYWALTGNYNAQVEAYRQEVIALSKNLTDLTNEYNGISPDFNAQVITQEMGVNAGLQYIIDTATTQGYGRILLKGTYELTAPLIINRLNENTNLSIIFYGNGVIKKGANFKGDRLIQIKIGFHDEDNIIFDNISFDGVDKTVNGIDNYDMSLPYNSEPTNINQYKGSKFIKFLNCSFNNLYMALKLSSLSYAFIGCLFEFNTYGAYLNCSANNNIFTSCSFRRNSVGTSIKTFSESLGTMDNVFYGCIFESNLNLGIYNNGISSSFDNCYFENNGYSIEAALPHHPNNKLCDIYNQDNPYSGGTKIIAYFNKATNNYTSIYGDFAHSYIYSPDCTIELTLANNTYIYTNTIANVKYLGNSTYNSSLSINGKFYVSNWNRTTLVEKIQVLGTSQTLQENLSFSTTNNITGSSSKIVTLTLMDNFNPFSIDLYTHIILTGKSSGGYSLSSAILSGNLLINKSKNIVVKTANLKLLENSGATLQNNATGPNLLGAGAAITATVDGNTITLNITGLNIEGVTDYGAITTLNGEGYFDVHANAPTAVGQYFSFS